MPSNNVSKRHFICHQIKAMANELDHFMGKIETVQLWMPTVIQLVLSVEIIRSPIQLNTFLVVQWRFTNRILFDELAITTWRSFHILVRIFWTRFYLANDLPTPSLLFFYFSYICWSRFWYVRKAIHQGTGTVSITLLIKTLRQRNSWSNESKTLRRRLFLLLGRISRCCPSLSTVLSHHNSGNCSCLFFSRRRL